jgi:hypothetical protein
LFQGYKQSRFLNFVYFTIFFTLPGQKFPKLFFYSDQFPEPFQYATLLWNVKAAIRAFDKTAASML